MCNDLKLNSLSTISWIANLNYDPDDHWSKEFWAREANLDNLLPRFMELQFDWRNVPELIRNLDKVFE